MSTTSSNQALTDSASGPKRGSEYYWLWVVCILGLDYFSTLAYQPSITYHATKRLGPLATAFVVLVTLFGALPVYCYLAARSPGGLGSLGIVDRLVRGWRGKTLVLILLGFAATDFTMLKSLSLADASVHVINKQNSVRRQGIGDFVFWVKDCTTEYCGKEVGFYVDEQLVVTILLGIMGFVFWAMLRKGFSRNVMILAVPLVGLYLLFTALLIAGGVWILYDRPEIVTAWLDQLHHGDLDVPALTPDLDGWRTVVFWSLLALPNLALGLSGFELSMILMPQVQGKPGEEPPRTRIWNTRKVLVTAALVMSALLFGAVLVTTLLIPPREFAPLTENTGRAGYANDRALSYLAHGGKLAYLEADGKLIHIDEPLLPFCGVVFGTAYDTVTVLILCLAGTSVMTALAVLMPMFLLRFGMEFRWTQRWGVLLMLFAGINMVVTIYFKANVEDQRGAYATGVLVLLTCAATVAVFDRKRDHTKSKGFGWGMLYAIDIAYYGLVALVFIVTMLAVSLRSGSGLAIAACFILAILAMSILSRAWRADELRTIGFDFKDQESKFMWDSLRSADFPVLVPIRPGRDIRDQKEKEIREHHQLSADAEIVLLEICVHDPSDFYQRLLIEVAREDNRYVIKVTNGVSVAHAIAAIALEMSRESRPPTLHLGWPEQDMLSASWNYLAFGEGNVAWKVRELIHRAEKDPAKRPRVVVG